LANERHDGFDGSSPLVSVAQLAAVNTRLKTRLAETEAALADAGEAQRQLESILS